MFNVQNDNNAETGVEMNNSKTEEKISALDLAAQIFPLLNDYFCGNFARNSKGILVKLENGQIFQFLIEEVV